MKNFARIICLMLVLMFLFSAVSCVDNNQTENTSGENATTVGDATDDLYDENGYLKSDLPELDYGGEAIHFLWWSDVENPEFFVEDQTGDQISDAIYKRNAKVESTLNVEIEWIEQKGQYNNNVGQEYANFVGNLYSSGSKDLDIMTAHTRTIALCSMQGYCADLLDLDYLDFEKPWWPQKLVETATIGDSLYYVTGDCSTNALHMMYTIFFNKDIMENNHIEDPAQLVLEDKWTIEALHRVTKGLYQDLDQDSTVSKGDYLGFTTLNWHLDGIYYGCGMILVENDPDELLVISPDYSSAKASDLAEKMYEWITTENVYTKSGHTEPFKNGTAFMSIGRNSDFTKTLSDWDFRFGITPCPMYDEDQDGYKTVLGNPTSFYSIFSKAEDKDRVAAFLECWASEGYRTTTPAVFEQTMKLRYSETSVESEIYDIMRNGIVFDVGRYYNDQLSDMSDQWDNCCISGNNWKARSSALTKVLKKTLADKIAKSYRDIAD